MYWLLEKFKGNTAAAPVVFLVLFLLIGGAALFLTPRLAAWLEQREKKAKPGFYDGMLTEDPNRRDGGEGDARGEEADESEAGQSDSASR